ncbi:hypothetical protein BDZ45DRAFT_734319 [Acephala macrosclerotiorum]|nr:hypothetical protein BDZ45DRAFT_734319 [Acephala macrosclerotiorum]
MKCSIVAAGLVAVVAAQNPSAYSKISVLSAELASAINPPSSIAAEYVPSIVITTNNFAANWCDATLATGLPSSVLAAITNPASLPGLISSLEAAATAPAWFGSLPADAQAWVLSAAGAYTSIEPEISSLAIAAGVTGTGAATGTSATVKSASSTGYSNTTIASTSKSSSSTATTQASSLTTSAAASSSSKASSSSSSGGAASPTGAVAAGVMGAVGILGLALAL